jgi:hypothetical protein
MAPRPARPDVAGPEMLPGPRHRHGFAARINGAGRIATMQGASAVTCGFPAHCLGLQAGSRICNQRAIDSRDPTFVRFRIGCDYFGLFHWRAFDRWDHGMQAAALSAVSSGREVEFLDDGSFP